MMKKIEKLKPLNMNFEIRNKITMLLKESFKILKFKKGLLVWHR